MSERKTVEIFGVKHGYPVGRKSQQAVLARIQKGNLRSIGVEVSTQGLKTLSADPITYEQRYAKLNPRMRIQADFWRPILWQAQRKRVRVIPLTSTFFSNFAYSQRLTARGKGGILVVPIQEKYFLKKIEREQPEAIVIGAGHAKAIEQALKTSKTVSGKIVFHQNELPPRSLLERARGALARIRYARRTKQKMKRKKARQQTIKVK